MMGPMTFFHRIRPNRLSKRRLELLKEVGREIAARRLVAETEEFLKEEADDR